MVDDRNARAKIWRTAIDREMRSDLTNIADRAFSRCHIEPTRPMQIVPLGLIFSIAVENLDAMVFTVRDIDPAISVATDIVCDVELPRIGSRLTPREQ